MATVRHRMGAIPVHKNRAETDLVRLNPFAIQALIALLAGCSAGQPTGASTLADAEGTDTAVSFEVSADTASADDLDSGAAAIDVAEIAGVDIAVDVSKADAGCSQPGCACSGNSACDSQFCIETPGGMQCAQPCTDACPTGFKCSQVSAVGGDIVNLCVPAHPRLCEPCAADSDCSNVVGGSESRCLPYHDAAGSLSGAFCGGRCDAASPCPSGFSCVSTTSLGGVAGNQCVRDDLTCACDPRAIELQLATSCSLLNSVGTCAGKRSCGPLGLSPCDAAIAVPEQCNFKDDNCNGQTDEPGGTMCDDGKTCTYDNCLGGNCQHPPATGPCTDDSACTTGDKCSDGDCVGISIVCDDGNGCTKDGCDLAKGCTISNDDGAFCNDGTVCTVADTCKGGVCLPGALTVCDDGNPCTTDSCNAKTGCVMAANSLPCSDGDVCTLVDICLGGACTPGANLICVDGNACTEDGCDAKTGCTFSVKSTPCDDSNQCTVGDSCSGGACISGAILACDDGNPCTSDVCLAQKGCVSSANSLACSDGNACTQGDICSIGACLPGPIATCSDGNPCTTDSCDPKGGCVFVANSLACTDNNECTVGDACAGGQCTPGGAKSCNDNNLCTDDSCDAVTGCVNGGNSLPCSDNNACTVGDNCSGGVCVAGGEPICEDNNVCTDDSCNKLIGCQHLPNAYSCSDGNACSVGDVCSNLTCVPGKFKVCSDGNPCTDDGCDPVSGCVALANSAACSDGDMCTQFDTCVGSKCVGGSPPVCDDGNLCTDDSCDKVKGCVHIANSAGCNDGNACTVGDACSAGTCAPGNAKSCDDLNPCTVDACDPVKGCQNTLSGGIAGASKTNAASNVTATGFTANWDKVAGATTYLVDVSAANDFSTFLAGFKSFDAGDNGTTNVGTLSCGTTYYYRVRASNACGVSLDSNITTVLTSACVSNIAAGNSLFGTPCPGPVTAIPITKPAGVTAGNVLIVTITASGSDVAITPPAGWVLVASNPAGGANCGSIVYYKVAGAAEPASYLFTSGSGTWPAWVITNFTGTFSNPPLDTSSATVTGAYTAQAINTSADNEMVVMVTNSGNGAQAWTAPAGMTSTNPGNINCTSAQMYYAKQALAGSTGAKTAKPTVVDTGAAYLLALH